MSRDPSPSASLSPSSGSLCPTRRDVLALGVGAFVVAAVPLAARSRSRLVRRRLPVMGTLADVAVVTRDPRRGRAAIDAAILELRRVDATMSRFRSDSEIGRLNAAAGRGGVLVGSETAFVLRRALAFAEATDGVFDPCLENTVVLWDVGHRRTPLDESRTRPLAGRRLYTRLALDLSDEGGVATLESPDAGVDLGGIAKGHAVDLAARALRRHGMEDGLVNVGGDLVALGVSPDGDSWRVGVRDPDDPHGVARVLEARDEAIATSGDYEAGFWYGGHRYHHLIDPRTARPGGGRRRSVTVRARTCLEADAAATAAFLMDERAAAASLPAAAPGVQVVVRL